MNLIKLLPLAALAITGIASATAPARSDKAAPSIVVRYEQNALVNAAAAKHLHQRIEAAAERVCHPLDSRILGLREEYQQCVRDAVTRGVADVDNAALTSYHRNHAFARVAAN